jgi:hypothetical protein
MTCHQILNISNMTGVTNYGDSKTVVMTSTLHLWRHESTFLAESNAISTKYWQETQALEYRFNWHIYSMCRLTFYKHNCTYHLISKMKLWQTLGGGGLFFVVQLLLVVALYKIMYVLLITLLISSNFYCNWLDKCISKCSYFWMSWSYGSWIYNYLSNQCLSP